MSLLDSNGPFDKYATFLALTFTTVWCLAHGLEVGAAQDFLQTYYAVLGLCDTGGDVSFSQGHVATGSCAFALPVFGLYLPVVLGTEASVSRHSRHTYGFWVWLGWTLYNAKYLVVGKDSFGGSPANYFWLLNNSFITYLHYRWVGNDLLGKFKLK